MIGHSVQPDLSVSRLAGPFLAFSFNRYFLVKERIFPRMVLLGEMEILPLMFKARSIVFGLILFSFSATPSETISSPRSLSLSTSVFNRGANL